jgi:uncharacterized protein YggE
MSRESLAGPLTIAVAIAAALTATALAFSVRPAPASATVAAANAPRSTVSVVGDGRVVVQPDVANLNIGVEATADSQATALADGATRMQAVVDTLVGQGISRDDIKTTRLSASPIYDQRDNSVIRGYRASSSVQVKVRQLDQVGQVVDAVTAAGANRVDGVTFAVDQIEGPKGQARALAMQNALTRADELANLAGMHVVSVSSISESDASSSPVAPRQFQAPQAAAAAAPPVEPGTQEVRSQVTVVYVIE